MKYLTSFVFTLVLATSALAQSQPSAPPTAGPVHVSVDSEAKDLATGYALAFTQLSRPPLTLTFQKDGVLRVLEDVKQVRAAGGVLVVEVGRGLIYAINPKDVVYLTDGPQITFKAAKP